MNTQSDWLLLNDACQTVIASTDDASKPAIGYSAYGWRHPSAGLPVLGFTGQRAEALTGWYHLGHGHRVYNPVLCRFHSPDRLSPFGAGGINAYGYCQGDPVNYRDPSGAEMDLPDWMADKYAPYMTIAGNVVGTATILVSALTAEKLTRLTIWGARGALVGGILAVTALSAGMATRSDEILLLGYVASGVNLVGGLARLGAGVDRYRKLRGARARAKRNARRLIGLPEQAVPASPVPTPRASDVLPVAPAPPVQTSRASELPYIDIYPHLGEMRLALRRMSVFSWPQPVSAPRSPTPLPEAVGAIRRR